MSIISKSIRLQHHRVLWQHKQKQTQNSFCFVFVNLREKGIFCYIGDAYVASEYQTLENSWARNYARALIGSMNTPTPSPCLVTPMRNWVRKRDDELIEFKTSSTSWAASCCKLNIVWKFICWSVTISFIPARKFSISVFILWRKTPSKKMNATRFDGLSCCRVSRYVPGYQGMLQGCTHHRRLECLKMLDWK